MDTLPIELLVKTLPDEIIDLKELSLVNTVFNAIVQPIIDYCHTIRDRVRQNGYEYVKIKTMNQAIDIERELYCDVCKSRKSVCYNLVNENEHDLNCPCNNGPAWEPCESCDNHSKCLQEIEDRSKHRHNGNYILHNFHFCSKCCELPHNECITCGNVSHITDEHASNAYCYICNKCSYCCNEHFARKMCKCGCDKSIERLVCLLCNGFSKICKEYKCDDKWYEKYSIGWCLECDHSLRPDFTCTNCNLKRIDRETVVCKCCHDKFYQNKNIVDI